MPKGTRHRATMFAEKLMEDDAEKRWTHDKLPRVPIPVELTDDIARNIQRVLAGHIPQWMLHIQKLGAPPAHPRMVEDIGVAVAYKKLAGGGQIKDRQSTKKISDLYGVSRKAV